MSADPFKPLPHPRRAHIGFADDFRRFFIRGLAAILPTLITLWLLVWAWDFLWDNIGWRIIFLIRVAWDQAGRGGWVKFQTRNYILQHTNYDDFRTRFIGVLLSIVLVYFIGVFVGNLIGHTFWRLAERAVLRVPLIRAIYPAVKQVTDFVLADRSRQFAGSRVVAVQPHEQNIWSIGLVTNTGQWTLGDEPTEMVTVFIPSTPTSFSGYLLVVPRNKVIELPMTVEEAMRLVLSGGVIMPEAGKTSGREMQSDSFAAAGSPAQFPAGGSAQNPAGRGALPDFRSAPGELPDVQRQPSA